MKGFFTYFGDKSNQIFQLFAQHLGLTVAAVVVAIIIGVPLGILITRKKKLAGFIIGVTNVIQAVPSLALLGFLIPILGIGSTPAIIMVFLYSLLPIVKNTYIGLKNINPDVIEAAKGIGLTGGQTLKMVQLPLALPVIMAGIRIAAVTAVGLMTIAAFIGAGGLGYLVFTGVQRVDNYMILSGAIPACILALLMDFVIGKVEDGVVPEGIKSNLGNGKVKKRKSRNRKTENRKKVTAIAILVSIVVILTGIFGYKAIGKKNTIVIGSKNYTEQLILGNMFASLVEHNTDIKVERRMNLGGSSVIWEAMKNGDVDIYVEYIGTGLVSIMKRDVIADSDKAYDVVKKHFHEEYGVEWLKPLGFNNTYVMAVREDTAKKYNLKTVSDLARVSDQLVLGCTMEFSDREDGYVGMKKLYNTNFKSVKPVDGGIRYTAIQNKESDVTDAFMTDGLLKAFNLKTLEDDKHLFPPYHAVPVIKEEVLEKYPELKEVLNKLSGQINNETMRELNYKVDKLGGDPREVADEFLKEKGLLK
ncbi:glycine betaine ABC transporter substrate-binding protein [Clostridium sp. MB40-C1]|uniref:ABC transporter permease/substrate-binding protein n=1 Tax=Clostridium sp. MB40-C1 TaxID=3070996 RepID=UPI0027E175AC|nr:glycine betaine ABC transporter substrate-binding protein [Clostridium sp. MB40-C1]WMJ79807.1 glycine betaine ABC transporter substrate-binding protein [Clostridium sp. MB40-C1]